MRRNILVCITTTALLSSCAYQGVVVEKRFRPVPFSASLGVDAMYNFQLRDDAGQTNSQMVTPDVFASYRVGDYFNDLQAPPAQSDKEMPLFRSAPPELNEEPYQPVRVMQTRPPERITAKIVVQVNQPPKGAIRIARYQTVRVVQMRPLEGASARVVVHPAQPAGSSVRLDRHQLVRLVQIPPPVKTTAKVSGHPNQRSKSALKTAVSHHRANSHQTTIAHQKKKAKAKVASKHHKHPRKIVASAS